MWGRDGGGGGVMVYQHYLSPNDELTTERV